MSVLLITSLGHIYFDLYYKDCPLASKNFLKLCKIKYYTHNLIYSVQKDFIAQSGSPSNSENSPNNQSIYGIVSKNNKDNFFKDEIRPKYLHNKKGLLCTANIGPDMNTSTFYITLSSNNLISLNGKHTIFGEVTKGFDVLDKINDAYCDEDNRPYQNIRIIHCIVLNDPFDDLEGMVIPPKSPEYKRDLSDNKHLDDDFDIDKFFKENDTEEKIKEKLREQESKNKTVMLELLEDLPNSNVKPPKNVLFICRLNPVTQAKDLEIIFEQFGPIKDCKIVRDKKTKQSLKYGFIEFEKIEDCEKAYLKMDGALIDDFRIKVDFSQSVSKNNKKEGRNKNKNKFDNKDEDSDEEVDNFYKKENRYNKFKDKELHIMNDEIRYKFEDKGKNIKKNEQFVFENKDKIEYDKNKNINIEKKENKKGNDGEVSRSSSESKTVSLSRSRSISKGRDKYYDKKRNVNKEKKYSHNEINKKDFDDIYERDLKDKYYYKKNGDKNKYKYKNRDKYYH